MHAVVSIAPDGTLSVAGPYKSEKLAERHAKKLRDTNPGLNAEVHQMERPTELAWELRQAGSL